MQLRTSAFYTLSKHFCNTSCNRSLFIFERPTQSRGAPICDSILGKYAHFRALENPSSASLYRVIVYPKLCVQTKWKLYRFSANRGGRSSKKAPYEAHNIRANNIIYHTNPVSIINLYDCWHTIEDHTISHEYSIHARARIRNNVLYTIHNVHAPTSR